MAHAPKHRSAPLPTLTQMVADHTLEMEEDIDMAVRQALFNAWQDSEVDPMDALDTMVDELLH